MKILIGVWQDSEMETLSPMMAARRKSCPQNYSCPLMYYPSSLFKSFLREAVRHWNIVSGLQELPKELILLPEGVGFDHLHKIGQENLWYERVSRHNFLYHQIKLLVRTLKLKVLQIKRQFLLIFWGSLIQWENQS